MVFAGFMAAAKDDRIRREDLKNEQDKEERSWQKQLDLLDITDRKQQEIIDRKLGKDTDGVMTMLGLDPTMRGDVAKMVDTVGVESFVSMYNSGTLSLRGSLSSTESSGNIDAFRTNKDGKSYGGEFQMGPDRLTDYNRANGTNWTPQAFAAASAEEQGPVNDWHFADIDSFINENGLDKYEGKVIGGVEMTRSGMIAMAHLGGQTGMKKFLETNGAYNKPDELGTTLSKYAQIHGGKTVDTAYAPEGFNLDDAKADPAESKVTFGEDNQMKDLGFAGLSMGEEPVDATLSTKSELVTEQPNPADTGPLRFEYNKPLPFDIEEMIKTATTEKEVVALENSVQYNTQATPEQKEMILSALAQHRQEIAALEDNSAMGAWDPATSPSKILSDITTVEKAIATEESIKANPTIPDDQKAAMLGQIVGLKDRLAAADVNGTSFDPNKQVATLIAGVTSVDDLLAAKTAISGDPRIPQEMRDAALGQLNGLQTQLTDREVAKAEQSGDPLSFVPLGSNGMYDSANTVTVVKRDGQWVDAGTNEPVDATNGRLLPPETALDVVKQYNDEFGEVAATVSKGANGVRDLLKYRELVIANPAAVNRYSKLFGSVLGEGEAAVSTLRSLIKADGSYNYGFESQKLNSIKDLTSADKLIAAAQLRAAYGLASIRGSSGQGLSDTELRLNLGSLGAEVSDPGKVIGMINAEISSVIPMVETNRAAQIDSVMTDTAMAESFKTKPFGMPFEQFLQTQLQPQELEQLGMALSDDRSYANVEAQVTGGGGFKAVTSEMVAADPRLAPYEGQNIKAVKRNGQIQIVVEGQE
jgi:hypothetical protein